ncbi:transposase [Streptomyces flaveolus]|uniref:transposase n=1 Tax=Streptomyces flaveolus TaxID=67297 RepID=UPI00370023D9
MWDNLRMHLVESMRQFIADHADWLTVFQLPSYSPDLLPQEGIWSLVKRDISQITRAVKRRLKQIQYRPGPGRRVPGRHWPDHGRLTNITNSSSAPFVAISVFDTETKSRQARSRRQTYTLRGRETVYRPCLAGRRSSEVIASVILRDTPLPLGGEMGWLNLGGTLTSNNIGVGRSENGELVIFARGTNSDVWHRWQAGSDWNSEGWIPMGGSITSDISVVSTGDLRVEIFVRGNDEGVYHRWQTAINNGWNLSGWGEHVLGGVIQGNVAVGRWGDGRNEVFVRGNDNRVYHQWQLGPNGAWNGSWASLGGGISSNITVEVNGDGLLEVYARGTNNHVWRTWLVPEGWHPWESLGGGIKGDVGVARAEGGKLQIFARGMDNAVWHRWQTGGGWNGEGWVSLGGNMTSSVAAARNGAGCLEIFARGADGAVRRSIETAPNSHDYSGWVTLQADHKVSSEITAARDKNGQVEIFALGLDKALYRHV